MNNLTPACSPLSINDLSNSLQQLHESHAYMWLTPSKSTKLAQDNRWNKSCDNSDVEGAIRDPHSPAYEIVSSQNQISDLSHNLNTFSVHVPVKKMDKIKEAWGIMLDACIVLYCIAETVQPTKLQQGRKTWMSIEWSHTVLERSPYALHFYSQSWSPQFLVSNCLLKMHVEASQDFQDSSRTQLWGSLAALSCLASLPWSCILHLLWMSWQVDDFPDYTYTYLCPSLWKTYCRIMWWNSQGFVLNLDSSILQIFSPSAHRATLLTDRQLLPPNVCKGDQGSQFWTPPAHYPSSMLWVERH